VLLAHFFVACHQKPRIFVTETYDWRVFDTLFSVARITFSRKAIYKLVNDKICGPQSCRSLSIAESVVKK
jgi:hypothetical protein